MYLWNDVMGKFWLSDRLEYKFKSVLVKLNYRRGKKANWWHKAFMLQAPIKH